MLKFTNGLFSRLCLLSTMAVTASQAAAAATNLIPQQQPKEERAALVMIEFVNEWLDPQGKLHGLIQDKRSLARSQEAGKRALEAARQAGMPVIHATLQLSPDYRELGRKPFGLRGAIPKAGTWQNRIKAGSSIHHSLRDQMSLSSAGVRVPAHSPPPIWTTICAGKALPGCTWPVTPPTSASSPHYAPHTIWAMSQ